MVPAPDGLRASKGTRGMSPTITGFIVVLLGVWCQFGGYQRTLVLMSVFTLFEAADAADLTALGGASITPAKLFLVFFVLRIVSMRGGLKAVLAEIAPRRVLFLYLILLLWVIESAIFFPRLFQNMADVFSLDRSSAEVGATPLRPSSGNITQAVYAAGSFVIALGFAVMARKKDAFETILTAMLTITGLDIGFAVLDIVTSATHTGFLLDVIHTGNYAFLTSDESGGLKRISGTFSEASSFATFSLELLAINFSLFLSRVRPRLTASNSIALFALLCLSTSSTAYVGIAVLVAAYGVFALLALLRDGTIRHLRIMATGLVGGTFVVCVAYLFLPSVVTGAVNLLNVSLFQKGNSDSAIERGALNTQAIRIFFDTYGVGAGIGSTRASNYILVLASNIGVVGLALFASLIIGLTIVRPRPSLSAFERRIVTAARVGMLASLVPATLIGTIFDLGPLFYVLVGIVASSSSLDAPPERRTSRGDGRRQGAASFFGEDPSLS